MELWLLGVHSEESRWVGMIGMPTFESPHQCCMYGWHAPGSDEPRLDGFGSRLGLLGKY